MLAEGAIGEGRASSEAPSSAPVTSGVAAAPGEHDRGLGELLLHRIGRGAGRESADRNSGDGGSGGDEHE